MVNIWLDDVRPAPDGWIWAKTAKDCIWHLFMNYRQVDILSLDHDLGEEQTGYDVAKKMVEKPSQFFPHRIYLHTSNPVGRANMFQLFRRAIDANDLDTKLNYGPYLPAWEESVKKSKELGYF